MDSRLIGLFVLVFVISGVGVYEYDDGGIKTRLSHSQYKQVIIELPEGVDVAVLDATPGKVEILSRSDRCDYDLFRITLDGATVKCGYYVSAEFDFQSRHLGQGGGWLGHFRKTTKRELTVEKASDGVNVILSVPYYAYRSGIRYSGDGGTLKNVFKVSKDRVKISQEHSNPFKTLPVCSGIRINRLEESAYFVPNDPSFSERENETYWYCGGAGKPAVSDPVVAVSSFFGGVKVESENTVIHETEEVKWQSDNLLPLSNGWTTFQFNFTSKSGINDWDILVVSDEDMSVELDVWENITRIKETKNCTTSTKTVIHANGTKEEVAKESCALSFEDVTQFDWTAKGFDKKLEVSGVKELPSPTKVYVFNNISYPEGKTYGGRIKVQGLPRGNVEELFFVGVPAGKSLKAAMSEGLGGGLDPSVEGSLKPVGLWNLSNASFDDSNNTVLDRSGNLFNLHNTSDIAIIDAPPGMNGTAIDFAGGNNNDLLAAVDSDMLDLIGGNFSISFWSRHDQIDITLFMVEKDAGGGAYGVNVMQNVNNKMRFNMDVDSYSGTSINTGGWFHWVVTHNTGGNVTWYLNGSLDSTTVHASNPVATTGRFTVGGRDGAGANSFNGALFCIQLFNFTINGTEVSQLRENADCLSLEEINTPPAPPDDGGPGAEPLSIIKIEFPTPNLNTNLTYFNVSNFSINHPWYGWVNDSVIANFTSNTTVTLPYGSETDYNLTASVSNGTHWSENQTVIFTHDNISSTISFVDLPSTVFGNSVTINVSYSEPFNNTGVISFNGTDYFDVETASSFFYKTFTGLPVGVYVFNASMNDTAGNANKTGDFSVEVAEAANVSILLNELNRNLTYEFGTTATINFSLNASDRLVCLDIGLHGYGRNYSCGAGTNATNVTWNLLREVEFNDTETSKTFTTDTEFVMSLDNRTFLQNVSFNISGVGNPENVTIYSNSDRKEVVLPGVLNGTVLLQRQFLFEGNAYEMRNITFLSSGVKTLFVNASNLPLNSNESVLDFRINVSAYSVDSGNGLDLFVTFNHSNLTLNYVNSSTLSNSEGVNGTWEDFARNRTAEGQTRWSSFGDDVACSKNEYRAGNDTELTCTADYVIENRQVYYETEFDVRNVSRIDLNAKLLVSCGDDVGGGTPNSFARLVFTDGTSTNNLFSMSINCNGGPANSITNGNFSFVNRFGTDVWNVYEGGVLTNTITVTLPSGNNWRFGAETHIQAVDSSSATSTITLYEVKVGSVMGSVSSDGNFGFNFSVQSTPLDTTVNDIVAATLDAVDLSSGFFGDANVSYELSNDNGVSWKDAPLSERIVFDTTGSDLVWRINCTTADVRDSCFVSQVRTRVVEGSVSNLSFDVGSDGVEDFEIGGFFNQSNDAVELVNSSVPVFNYLSSNCLSKSCAVPVSISSQSGGVVQVNSLNFSRQIRRVFFNTTFFDGVTDMRFSVNFTEGSVTVNDVNVDYRGTKSFIVSAVYYGTGTADVSNASLNVTVKYSPFNLTFPANVSDWFFTSIKSREDKNVTPFGQKNDTPIRNITSRSYDSGVNISVYLNNSFAELVNLTFNNTRGNTLLDKGSLILNTSAQQVCDLSTDGNSCGIWAWLDLNVTSSVIIVPTVWYVGLCEDCFKTFDWETNNVVSD